MTDWATFAAATVALTAFLLYVTRRSQRTLERVRIVDGTGDPKRDSLDGTAELDEPPRTFDHPDAVDRDFDDLDTPVENAADPFLDEDRTTAEGSTDPAPTDSAPPGTDPTSSDRLGERDDPSVRSGPTLTTELLLANVAFSQALALAVLVGIAWWTDVPSAAFGLAESDFAAPVFLSGIAVGVLLYLGNELAAAAGERFGVAAPERLREAMAPDDARGWGLLLVVVLPVIAVFEEALFRGALIGAFAVGFGIDPWLLAVVSSIAFGLGHGAQGRVGIVVTGLLGFALAALFVYTGSLLLVVVAHYVVNALEFVVREGFGWDPSSTRASAVGGD
ncbi:lysostaphin resistance A-like protein [Halorubrum sp. DTA98]|uniref:CPBP family intramembrane glutamic endopeptidase n=1 Tax=Halorubrum sp. DTA98 TaxID=3402163 RepID=UPI003AACD64C